MATFDDIPNEIISLICTDSYITTWFLSQCCKSLRKFKPIGLTVNEFIIKLLSTQSPSIIEYYINISDGTKKFWRYFTDQYYILAYIGQNCDLHFIEWVTSTLLPEVHKIIIMEFAVLKMNYKELSAVYNNLEKSKLKNTVEYNCFQISIKNKAFDLGYKLDMARLDTGIEIIWCFRHNIIPKRIENLISHKMLLITNYDISQYYRFYHRDLPLFLQELQLMSNLRLTNLFNLDINQLDFEYGKSPVDYFPRGDFTNKNLGVFDNYPFEATINLKCVPFSNKEIDFLIERIIKGDNITPDSIKILKEAKFLPRYDELMNICNKLQQDKIFL